MSQISELQSLIEELRTAEEQLRAQNQELLAAHTGRDEADRRYREPFAAGPDGLLVTDEDGKIESNPAAAELFEVPLSRLSGKVLAGRSEL